MTTARQAATPEEAAYVFLEQARQELIRDKEIIPLAVLVHGTGEKQTYDLIALMFTDETKRAAFQQVIAMAKEKSAKAIITVAQARFGKVDNVQSWSDCIFVTITGPGIETVTLHLPYTTSRLLRRIKFGELQRKVQQRPPNFLQGWPD